MTCPFPARRLYSAKAMSYRVGSMIGTFQALLVAILAVLPGALYTIALENSGATWAWRKTDASTLVVRLLIFSAAFHALVAPLTYYAYRRLLVNPVLENGWQISWRWYALLLAYTALPYLFGVLTEKGRRVKGNSRGAEGVRRIVALWAGGYPELRAWDWLFSKRPVGVMRLRLTNGEWKAGLFAGDSFASSYGEEGDIWLAEQYYVDDLTGRPVILNQDYVPTGAGLLIRWSEVAYADFTPWV